MLICTAILFQFNETDTQELDFTAVRPGVYCDDANAMDNLGLITTHDFLFVQYEDFITVKASIDFKAN